MALTHHAELPPDAVPTVRLRGVSFAQWTEARVVQHVSDELTQGRGGWIVTPNVDILRRATKDRSFNHLIHQATLRVADGMPLIWASRLLKRPLPERVAGSSLVSTLAAELAEQGRTLYLLGGAPGTADEAARVLKAQSPGLRIVGVECPPMGFEQDAEALSAVQRRIVQARPDVVYVALGSPKQELVIRDTRGRLPGTWWAGVGVSFSFLAGDVKRAPRWVQAIGMEWVHRFVQEPGKLFKRYFVHGIPFAVSLLVSAAWHRGDGVYDEPSDDASASVHAEANANADAGVADGAERGA